MRQETGAARSAATKRVMKKLLSPHLSPVPEVLLPAPLRSEEQNSGSRVQLVVALLDSCADLFEVRITNEDDNRHQFVVHKSVATVE